MTTYRVYPAPTLVIGVGRLGLATLERLGDDWMGLKLSGADASIRNLRLISVRARGQAERPGPEAAEPGDGDVWRRRELPAVRIASYLGDGDLPSRALDLAVLRSLGLVRYRDGTYQVGVPRDGGVVEVQPPEGEGEAPKTRRRTPRAHRRRYFEWVSLSPDPIVAAERLRQATEGSEELDLFLTPLVNRVRQGSPATLVAAIARCFAHLEGRDPGPWRWLGQGPDSVADGAGAARLDGTLRLPLGVAPPALLGADHGRPGAVLQADLELGELPEPLPGWRAWIRRASDDPSHGTAPEPALSIPAAFVAAPYDRPTPLSPRDLLSRDWHATSWAIDDPHEGGATFLPLPVSPLRLGLFDHDGRAVDSEVRNRFRERLRDFGRHVHSGLVRLWVDLQRVRVAEPDSHFQLQDRPRDELDDALRQSLEILGELVVRPLATGEVEDQASLGPDTPNGTGLPGRPPAATERELPDEPSRFLSGMIVDEGVSADPVRRLLAERLADLGLARPGELEGFRSPLLTDCPLGPEDLPSGEGTEAPVAVPLAPEPDRGAGLQELRRTLNGHVRSLYDFDFLARYRSRPTRRPPRLTVFVVGDMSEPFVRAALRPVLRKVHAELLRAFTPIFRTYREGFDRSLCVTPILWTPHPADPFQGGDPEATRREEAVIIDAVHGIRHWVECVLPAGKRFIPQIFVNSQVTDVSTLSLRDAVRQTRDFLSLQIRNDTAGDPWLRTIAAGSGQADLFSSFSCYETDFPALRCREYLANRMSREVLGVILDPPASSPRTRIEDREEEKVVEIAPPPLDELVCGIRNELQGVTESAGREIRDAVLSALAVGEVTRAADVEEAYDEDFEASLRRRILDRWRELTGRLGKIDDMVDDLRRRTSELLSRRVEELRAHDDRAILDSIGKGGLARALGRLHRLRSRCRDLFKEHETERRDREELAGRHAIPELRPLTGMRAALLAAARDKPDAIPLRLGAALLGALALVLGAPMAHALAYLADLHVSGGLAEALLGPLAPVTGGLALWLPAWAVLRWHLARRTVAVRAAQERLAESAERILQGTGRPLAAEPPTSIRSFLEARLELTGAVAARGFARHVLERVLADTHLAERLRRSIDIQSQTLQRRAEDLGVRATLDAGEQGEEDLERLLVGHGLDRSERLISADGLRRYYHQVIRQPADLQAELTSFVRAAGGIEHWRTEACLADTEAILAYCRHTFRGVVDEAIWAQPFFREDVARSLDRFVERCYSNLGFGAEFRGYEGLDADGVPVLADAALVLHRELARVYAPSTRTLEVRRAEIRPNAAYMLSLVQGIRVHSLRNLKRFESFHDRPRMPDDRAFPLTQESPEDRSHRPVNLLSGLEEVTSERSRALLGRPVGFPAEGDRD